MKIRQKGALALMLGLMASSVARSETVSMGTPYASENRTFLVHTPLQYNKAHAYPLMVVFHGDNQNAADIERFSGFDAIADRGQFIVVYPDTSARVPGHAWKLTGSYSDIAFGTEVLIPLVEQDFKVDRSRIYLAGYDTGTEMAKRLVCATPNVFAGLGLVAELPNNSEKFACSAGSPLPVVMFHGSADPLSPLVNDASPSDDEVIGYSPDTAMSNWAQINHCKESVLDNVADTIADGSASIKTEVDERRTSSGCTSGTSETLYLQSEGGHTWPGGGTRSQSDGAVSTGINASAIIYRTLSSPPSQME